MTNNLNIVPANPKYNEAIKELLRSEKLPVEDLAGDLENFFIATDGGDVIGSIGLEVYGQYGLLRSLIVKSEYRRLKIAGELVKQVEILAKKLGIHSIYLLTETAEGYFSKKGFIAIKKSEVPDDIKNSSEFSHVCPETAILMLKDIR